MDQPAAHAPAGQISDFNAPNTLQKWNVLCQTVCLTASSVIIALRVYTKIRIMGTMRLGPEDYTCFISWIMLLGYAVMALLFGSAYGGGEHVWNMSTEKLQRTLEFNNDQEIVYGPTVLFAKVSLLILYAKIFVPVRKSITWWSIYTLLWFIVFFYISVTLVKIFECIPRSRIWDHSVKGACVDNGILLIVTGSINLATDVFLLVLPLLKVWRLKLSQERRLGLVALFALGSLAPIATILRLEISIRYKTDKDTTYAYFGILLWTVAEVTTGIICSSLPILPAFFRHFYPKVVSRVSGYTNGTPVRNAFFKGSRVSSAKAGDTSFSRGYLELDEIDVMRSQHLVSTATAGQPEEWPKNEAGIMKTTQILQIGAAA